MGQKVHPTGIRLGIVKKHTSVWFAEGQEYADNLLVDLQVREFVKKRLASACTKNFGGDLKVLYESSLGPEWLLNWSKSKHNISSEKKMSRKRTILKPSFSG